VEDFVSSPPSQVTVIPLDDVTVYLLNGVIDYQNGRIAISS
jgi:hypothetical protein